MSKAKAEGKGASIIVSLSTFGLTMLLSTGSSNSGIEFLGAGDICILNGVSSPRLGSCDGRGVGVGVSRYCEICDSGLQKVARKPFDSSASSSESDTISATGSLATLGLAGFSQENEVLCGHGCSTLECRKLLVLLTWLGLFAGHPAFCGLTSPSNSDKPSSIDNILLNLLRLAGDAIDRSGVGERISVNSAPE